LKTSSAGRHGSAFAGSELSGGTVADAVAGAQIASTARDRAVLSGRMVLLPTRDS
jgi:hypothetical protein